MKGDAMELPDPRRYGSGGHPLARLAAARGTAELAAAVEACLSRGDGAALKEALRAVPDVSSYSVLWETACQVAERRTAQDDPGAVALQLFAIPLVIVAGSRGPARLPGTLPDIAAVTSMLAEKGAVGPTRNFGLSNALIGLETMEVLDPGAVYRWARDGAPPTDWAPAPIVLEPRSEQVHLRFLVGAGFSAASAPPFVETAANIGTWGMPLTRLLAGQLAADGVELLPIPRPPARLLAAAHAGRMAQLGAALNLFMTNALRRFRLAVGDPVAVLSAHENGELRLTLSTPLDESLVEGFRWPLDRLDDVAAVEGEMRGLLAECRVGDVRSVARVLPDLNAGGVPWFPRGEEADAPAH